MTVRAIYENGVFRPTEPVNLPENAEVEVLLPASSNEDQRLNAIYRILGESYVSGKVDVPERHNEHQPRPLGSTRCTEPPSRRSLDLSQDILPLRHSGGAEGAEQADDQAVILRRLGDDEPAAQLADGADETATLVQRARPVRPPGRVAPQRSPRPHRGPRARLAGFPKWKHWGRRQTAGREHVVSG